MFQSSLDSIVSVEPRRPPFTTQGLLDYVVELVVCEDEVCLYVLSVSSYAEGRSRRSG
jgi:hypothetical protein